jgi:hypothetical protein
VKVLDRSDSKGLRYFALGLAALLVALFWGVGPWLADRPRPLWPLIAGWVLVTMAWVWPPSVWPVHRALVPVARVIATINTWLLLGFVFFGILWPTGWTLRRLGRLQYRTGFEPAAPSYRVRAPDDHVTRLEEPF